MIDKANVQSGTDAWTQAQIAFLSQKYADWASQIDAQIASPQPPA